MSSIFALKRVLISGLGDWVYFEEVLSGCGFTINAYPSLDRNQMMATVLELTQFLLNAKLMVAGDLKTADGKPVRGNKTLAFFPLEGSPHDVVSEIERRWRGLTSPPLIGDICWLSNTELGNVVARELLAAYPLKDG